MSEYKVHRIRFIESYPKPINSAAYDTVDASPKLALSREDGSIEIRDPANKWIVDSIIPGQDGRTIEHLVWNEGRLFSGGLNSEIIEWDLEKLRPKYSEDSCGGPVWCLRFNHQKTCLAAGCEDGSIRIFRVMSQGLFYEKSLHKQESRILSLAWSHDDKTIVSGGYDSTIRIYQVKTGQITSRITTTDKDTKQTMVWAVEVLNDFTVVTGDSLGNTQFWDGNTGTLIATFQSHNADVLTLAVFGKIVYSSGVDSKISQFSLIEKTGVQEWALTNNIRPTNYDIRTLVVCKSNSKRYLLAAGVDPSFIVLPFGDLHWKNGTRYSCLPPTDACQLAPTANQIMFRDQHKLHLWQLEDTEISVMNACKKLVEVNSDSDDHLVSSAISACGKYLCYSTISKAKFYSVLNSPLKLKKIFLPVPPLLKIAFSPDSGFMVGATFTKALHLVNLRHENNFDIDISNQNVILPLRLLEVSNNSQLVCIVDSASKCFVYKILDNGLQFLMQLPSLGEKISNVAFHPETNNVFLSTSFKKVFEFNLAKGVFASWLIDINKSKVFQSLGKQKHMIRQLAFNPKSSNEMFIQSQSGFGKLHCHSDINDMEEQPQAKKRKISQQTKETNTSSPLKVNKNFKKVMHFSFNSKGEMVIVESPPAEEALPEPFKVKKYQQK